MEQVIADYLQGEFCDKMRMVDGEINVLVGRLDEEATTIDEVISHLAYIDTLKDSDNKVQQIADYIDVMNEYVNYIDSLKIIMPIELRMRFWNMRNWPRMFKVWLKNRQNVLLAQKERLIIDM